MINLLSVKVPILGEKARRLLSNLLGVKLLILGDISKVSTLLLKYKINAIINEFLSAGDKFMPELNLRQPGFTYSVYGPFTKNKRE